MRWEDAEVPADADHIEHEHPGHRAAAYGIAIAPLPEHEPEFARR
jgi:hypothetical protein